MTLLQMRKTQESMTGYAMYDYNGFPGVSGAPRAVVLALLRPCWVTSLSEHMFSIVHTEGDERMGLLGLPHYR
ncbi:hypothetical protein VTI74DRAFT_7971 [Chaetomium olivicolor]